jgi:hypothetical protein
MPLHLLRPPVYFAPRACWLAASERATPTPARESCLAASETEGGSTACVPVLTITACSTMEDPAWWCRGAWVYVCLVLARSGALHTHMHFDKEVLDHLGTGRPLRARSTIGVGLHNRDRPRWMGACSACVPASQNVWGATPTAIY